MSSCTIYGLASADDGVIRYIGQTVRKLHRRLSEHRAQAKRRRTPIHFWFQKHDAEGIGIIIVPLLLGATWSIDECDMIARYRDDGFDLLNATDGGDGHFGWKKEYRPSPKRGVPLSVASIAKMRATKAAHPQVWTDDRRARMSAKMKVRIFSDQHRARITAGKIAAWARKRAELPSAV